MAEEGIGHLTLVNRSQDKLMGLAGRSRGIFPSLSLDLRGPVSGHDIIINSTSPGLRSDDPLPVDPAEITPGMLVADVIMEPAETPLLAEAKARGARIDEGPRMPDGQIAEILSSLTEDRRRGSETLKAAPGNNTSTGRQDP